MGISQAFFGTVSFEQIQMKIKELRDSYETANRQKKKVQGKLVEFVKENKSLKKQIAVTHFPFPCVPNPRSFSHLWGTLFIFSFIEETERKIASLQEALEEAEKLAQAAMEEKDQVSGQASRLKDFETEFQQVNKHY